MEQIKKFDEALEKIYHNEFQMNRIGTYLMMILSVWLMIIPITSPSDNGTELNVMLFFDEFILLNVAISMYLKPYMQVRESGKMVSIYQKLQWMPVKKKEIQAVRKEYLNRICLKLLCILLIAQQIAALLDHSWSFLNVLYPAFTILLVWLLTLKDIYSSKR